MSILPTGFEALAPFAAKWAVEGTATRAALRGESTGAERQAFYDAGAPLLAAALDHLDATALADHDPAQKRLMNLMLSLAHVSLAIESQGPDEDKHTPNRNAMIFTRSTADAG